MTERALFPSALTERAQWILWRGVEKIEKRTGVRKLDKVPTNPQTLHNASTTDPRTWATCAYCVQALPLALEEWQSEDPAGYRGGGLGFVFTAEDPFCGIDLDHCRDPQTRVIHPWAQQLLRTLRTYAEASPSGTGVHLLGQVTVGHGLKRGPLELYDRGRFFTMTGDHLEGTPVTLEAIQQPVDWLRASMDVLAKALERHGERFSALFAGEWQASEYLSQSEADLALCSLLVQCGATTGQCDAVMRLSGLMRDKWDARHGAQTYGELTIAKALQSKDRRQTVQVDAAGDDDEPMPLPEQAPWPVLEEAAYYGLAGEIVRTIAPYTESDPVAVLVHFLAMYGNVQGRNAYFPIEADYHRPNIYAGVVGKTSRGRKGTSAGYPRRVMSEVDKEWRKPTGGLSSGEGIIWNVRDAIGEEGKKGYDEGVSDKRLCILQSEFAGALKKMGQEGNILSQVLRDAWDHGILGSLTSGRIHSPVQATNAHISMVVHITLEELRRLLTETEAANGFANRFLWVCVQRSKLLPDGGGYPEQDLRPFLDRLRHALPKARQVGRMQRNADARNLWHHLYRTLTEERPGLLGAITARAEAHVLRLSMLYALLDVTATITPAHLHAAYALWRYCDASARYIFGERLGDPRADELLLLLRTAGPAGMTRTEMYQALSCNVKSEVIGATLLRLQRENLVYATRKAGGKGRPTETWHPYVRNVLNVINPHNGSTPTSDAPPRGK